MPIENAKEGRVGSIADLVLAQDNTISAIIVSDGGFLGVGNARVPVEPNLIAIYKDPNGKLRAQTNITEKQLDAASAGVFMTKIEAMNDNYKKPTVRTVARLIGTQVNGPDEKLVATVNNVLFSPVGDMQYAVLSVGGMMGLGAKLVAVKSSSLKFSSTAVPLHTTMTLEQLKNLAPVRNETASLSSN
jgi:hypothetical protein